MTGEAGSGDRRPDAGGGRDWQDEAHELARAVLQLAEDAGMPDSYWQTDSRVARARELLGIPEDGRYSHNHVWAKAGG